MSEINISLKPSQVRPYAMDGETTLATLECLGVRMAPGAMESYQAVVDAAPALQTTPSVSTPLQFLQTFIAEAVEIVTTARVADEIVGRDFAGNWYDEEIVIPIMERIGQARPYGDTTNLKMASWNNNFDARTVFRAEIGLSVGRLETMRASAMRVDSLGMKRNSCAEALAIIANDIAFNGYNGGANRTYGLLNDPNLSAYVTVASGTGGTKWSAKNFDEITADIRTAVNALRIQSGAHFDPTRDSFVMAVALSAMDAFNYTSQFGYSVYDFVKKNYPNARIVGVPQFDGANGGSSVFYVIADRINGRKCVMQLMQADLFLLGVEQKVKGHEEGFSNATAGMLVSQPIGIVRYTGI